MIYMKRFINSINNIFKKVYYGYQVKKIKDDYDYKIPENLRKNKDFLMIFIKVDTFIRFEMVSEELRDDKDIVLEAVKRNGWALKYTSERLKDDKEIVLVAVKRNGWALMYASERLRDDEDIVLVAVKKDVRALECVSEKFKDDKQFVLQVIGGRIGMFQHLSDRLKDNKDMLLEIIKKNMDGYRDESEKFKDDKKLSTLMLYWASDRLQNDKELLELLEVVEKESLSDFNANVNKWYKERMEILANIREKELMENYINASNKPSKKIKF